MLDNLILLLAMQSVLILAPIKPYAQLPRTERTPRKLLGSVCYGLFLLAVFSLCYSLIPSHIRENENATIGYVARAAVHAGLALTTKYPYSSRISTDLQDLSKNHEYAVVHVRARRASQVWQYRSI